MRYLITGCSGFVGAYLIRRILEDESDARVFGVDLTVPTAEFGPRFMAIETNMLNAMDLAHCVHSAAPERLIHLASFSSVGYSWGKPIESFKNNTNIFLNLLEALHNFAPACKVLSVGSSEEYGIVSASDLPLRETAMLKPTSPYGVARVAQESFSTVFAKGFGMNIVCTRSFNHLGAGQSPQFVVSAIGRQFVELEKGLRSSITVGDTSVVRDFLDVRDVVRAYLLLLRKGQAGEVYNICSGVGRSIADVIAAFMEVTGLKPAVEVDQKLLRPVENPAIVGSHEKITKAFGWKPEIDFPTSLASIIDYWRNHVPKHE